MANTHELVSQVFPQLDCSLRFDVASALFSYFLVAFLGIAVDPGAVLIRWRFLARTTVILISSG